MPDASRNAPCPCGSGLKYKQCCLARQPAAVPGRAGDDPGARVVERKGKRSRARAGVTEHDLDRAAGHSERKPRGQGPAAQLAEFSRPLVEAAGNDPEALQRAMTLGMVFWNLAVCPEERARKELLESVLAELALSDDEKADFRSLAEDAVARHRRMFPELHRGRG